MSNQSRIKTFRVIELTEQGFEFKSVLFQSSRHRGLVQWSERSHLRMAVPVFAHSSKSLIENINTKQWKLNEYS